MDLTAMTDVEFWDLVDQVRVESERRAALASIPQQAEALNAAYLEAEGTAPDQDWRQPTGAHDAYPLDWTVQYGGKRWRSTTPANVWAPGTSGWVEVVPEGGGPAAWVQPTGAHDAYALGARVTHSGSVWESTTAANVWEPGVYGWVQVAQ